MFYSRYPMVARPCKILKKLRTSKGCYENSVERICFNPLSASVVLI